MKQKRYRKRGRHLVEMTQEQVDALDDPSWKMCDGKVILHTAAEKKARAKEFTATEE